MSEARDIKRLLEVAFLGVQRDEQCTLHQAQLADQSLGRKTSREEWEAAGRLDPETDWRDVPAVHWMSVVRRFRMPHRAAGISTCRHT